MSTISKSNNNGMNNKNSNKTTSLKTFLMLSIIPLVLVIGGVIPVYAQTIWFEDVSGPSRAISNYSDHPECTTPGMAYIVGHNFIQNSLVNLLITE